MKSLSFCQINLYAEAGYNKVIMNNWTLVRLLKFALCLVTVGVISGYWYKRSGVWENSVDDGGIEQHYTLSEKDKWWSLGSRDQVGTGMIQQNIKPNI